MMLRSAQSKANEKYAVGGRRKREQPPQITLPELKGRTKMAQGSNALRTIATRYDELLASLKEAFDSDDVARMEELIEELGETTRTLADAVDQLEGSEGTSTAPSTVPKQQGD